MHAFYSIIAAISLTLIGISAEEIFSKDGPFTPTKGSVMANIEISDEMHFEMDIVVHSLPDSGTESILHCGTKNHSPSERFPAIFLYEPSRATGFNVRLTTSDTTCCGEGPTHSPALNLEQSYHLEVEFTQSWLSVKVDGESTYFEHHGTHATGQQPCYAGNPWIDAADVTISNLRILSGLPTEAPSSAPRPAPVSELPEAPETAPAEVEPVSKEDTVTISQEEVDAVMNGANLCEGAYDRGFANPSTPDKCPDGYPDHDGALLCHGPCPDGWYLDFSKTRCYKNCPDGWTDAAGTCWNDVVIHDKGSKGRGVGIVPNACGSGQEKSGGLCYNKCRSGYHGGGCFCYNNHNWFNQYGRGCGWAPDHCPSSHPDMQGGLCYKSCPASHSVGVGPVCWEHCEQVHGAGFIDTGISCQKGEIKSFVTESKPRPVKGLVCRNGEQSGANCYEKCRNGFDGVLGVCWNQNLDESIAAVLATGPQIPTISLCYQIISPYLLDVGVHGHNAIPDKDYDAFTKCAWPMVEQMIKIQPTGDWSHSGVTVAATYEISRDFQVTGSPYEGIAFEFEDKDTVNIYSFVGVCDAKGTSIGFGIQGGIGMFRKVTDIDGGKSYFSMGFDVMGNFGMDSSWVFDDECKVSGMSSNVQFAGIGISAILDVNAGTCINIKRKYLTTLNSGSSSQSSAAVSALSNPLPAVYEGSNHYDEPSKYTDGGEGGEYVFVFSTTWTLAAALLCIVASIVTISMVCLRCGLGHRVRVYGDVEMSKLNEV